MIPRAELSALNSTIDRFFAPPGSAHAAGARRWPVVRPLRPSDLPRVEAMSPRLSPTSLHHRFFVGTPAIPAALLRQLRRLDHRQQEAVVALVGTDVVGLAQYASTGRPARADLAVLVVDSWQRMGVGRALVTRLADLASAQGVRTFDAAVLPGNDAAHLGIAAMWPGALGTADEDSINYQLPLPPPG
ncbi:sortase-like acyltransferase [Saccharomonospora marina XMU15]|uniref:Sortase-like acyltransferase n=1 Tax=Saccharomonospora marina XMU15 TaxID=882083 RepID=H5X9L2_9PSEU|nr:GNAT family N-acetyltransferase [Saccharomonospora marina]EHR51450.1 sortase-like acyltransferase [Saccharomonospora marina XMU15]